MNILADLFLTFAKIGCFTFGGGYAMISLIEDVCVEKKKWITHDLRFPLTSIKGYAQGLKDGIADTEEKQKRYYDAILTRADDLERLTDSLSLLVRLENDNSILHMETVCFDEYICQFLSEKEPWLIQQQIEVDYRNEAGNAEISLDIREMHRVFMNLFENTVRYRVSDRSRVKLSVTAAIASVVNVLRKVKRGEQ